MRSHRSELCSRRSLMAQMTTSGANGAEIDTDLVQGWLQADPVRWIAGILGGCFAGVVAQLVGGAFAVGAGLEFVFPAKLMATVLFGAQATHLNSGAESLLAGFVFFEVWGAFW